MTREEKLQQFAEQNTKGLHLDRHNLIQMVKQGAEWADQHPQWIPVEERLPKRMNEKSRFSETVLVYNKEGYKDAAYYDYEEKIWRWMPMVTHWMPIVPPRKEE